MVLIILSMIGIFSHIWLSQQLPRVRLDGALQAVISDLRAARRAAIADGYNQRIVFLDPHRYVVVSDINGNGMADPDEPVRARDLHDHYPGVTITATNNPIFHPRGTASHLATLTLRNASGSRAVTIGITGRIAQKS